LTIEAELASEKKIAELQGQERMKIDYRNNLSNSKNAKKIKEPISQHIQTINSTPKGFFIRAQIHGRILGSSGGMVNGVR
jgi:hypothetical protein